jgi:hypothetical protein
MRYTKYNIINDIDLILSLSKDEYARGLYLCRSAATCSAATSPVITAFDSPPI